MKNLSLFLLALLTLGFALPALQNAAVAEDMHAEDGHGDDHGDGHGDDHGDDHDEEHPEDDHGDEHMDDEHHGEGH